MNNFDPDEILIKSILGEKKVVIMWKMKVSNIQLLYNDWPN
jgi:hypothetical protein